MNFPVGSRYKKQPWRDRSNKRPSNQRLRCSDCGAQFHEQTQATQMDLHCFKAQPHGKHGGPRYLHHSWSAAVTRTEGSGKPYFVSKTPRFYRVSDAVQYWERETNEEE